MIGLQQGHEAAKRGCGGSPRRAFKECGSARSQGGGGCMGNGRRGKSRSARRPLYLLITVMLAVTVPMFYVGGMIVPAHAAGGNGNGQGTGTPGRPGQFNQQNGGSGGNGGDGGNDNGSGIGSGAGGNQGSHNTGIPSGTGGPGSGKGQGGSGNGNGGNGGPGG